FAHGEDSGGGRNDAAIGEVNAGAGRRLGADTGQDLDAVNLQAPCRVVGEVGREGGQDAVGVLDDVEPHLIGLDVRVVLQRAADQLPHLGYRLHAWEAAADGDERQELLLDRE